MSDFSEKSDIFRGQELIMDSTLSFFSQQGSITEPGPYAHLFDNLPTSVADLCKVVQGTNIHVFWAQRYGIELSAQRQEEVQLRQMQRRLARMVELDACPLSEPRSLDKKLVGNCRDFSVTLAAILRHQGVPARARCGFGAYFLPNHFEDHWVCEYWNADQRRWVLVDAQLDVLQRDVLKISFEPLDVPRDQFIVGGLAWHMARSGQADPDAFVIFDMHGLWFIRGDFVRDVAALNKVELLPWDSWGIIEQPDEALTPDDLALLDRLADLTCGDVPEFATVRALYESDPRLRVPGTIHTYLRSGVKNIELAAA
jgi:Transglutaminase-like superfamily